jgi:hypothetical protein
MYCEYNRAVMCMQRGIALRNALFNCFHCRNSLYVASCESVSFYCWKFLLSLPLHVVAFYFICHIM